MKKGPETAVLPCHRGTSPPPTPLPYALCAIGASPEETETWFSFTSMNSLFDALHLSFALHLAVVVLEHIALAALFVDACDLETLLCSNCIVLCFFFDGVVLLYQELLSALVLLLSSFADLFPCLFSVLIYEPPLF